MRRERKDGEKSPEDQSTQRVSLYGMDVDDALRKALSTPPPNRNRDEAALAALIAAFHEFSETGKSTLRCNACGSFVEFKQLGERAHESHCDCGKFNDTLRGI